MGAFVISVVPYIIVCIVISLSLIYFQLYFLSLIPIIMAVFLCWFFRDPERSPRKIEGSVVAPADGKIVKITEGDGNQTTLSIFMSPIDVHVNRAPISGRVTKIQHVPGKHNLAFLKNVERTNEKNYIEISTKSFKIHVVQIAGFFARRIDCYIKEGDEVKAGQRIGMIRFGSRVDLILPPRFRFLVKEGMKVKAGETIVAEHSVE